MSDDDDKKRNGLNAPVALAAGGALGGFMLSGAYAVPPPASTRIFWTLVGAAAGYAIGTALDEAKLLPQPQPETEEP